VPQSVLDNAAADLEKRKATAALALVNSARSSSHSLHTAVELVKMGIHDLGAAAQWLQANDPGLFPGGSGIALQFITELMQKV
jgi:hypothetical protein